MKIYGIGTDILNVTRIEAMKERKYYHRFLKRILAPREIVSYNLLENEAKKAIFLAKRFSAKEAYFKALGVGYRFGLAFNKINLSYDDLGKPFLELLEGNLEIVNNITGNRASNFISWSDEYPYILSFAVITIF